mmetsp:Transcript_38332/g.68154  ORF Transcript_38332/g.68154 Transcript_38332/m.68154 type:complete len:443 (+) Transcript_38332:1-1329(+)
MQVSKKPYEAVSQRWLLSFEAMARQLREEHTGILTERDGQAAAFFVLVKALGVRLDRPGPRSIRAHTRSGMRSSVACSVLKFAVTPFGLSRAVSDPDSELQEVPGAWAVLPLVCLPLAFYVRSTTHLYEMLERLQSRAPDVYQNIELPRYRRNAKKGANRLRKLLDRDERQYSYLVFAIVAALQTLFLARNDMNGRFPLALLASSPPDPAGLQRNGYPMLSRGDWKETQFIFRGVWIAAEVDEERARFQYSFQSFSREVSGMTRVLSFYAGISGCHAARTAAEHKHILVLIARVRWSEDGCLAMPVQLFDGPRESSSETEVLLPPYVRYELEDDLALSSSDFGDDGPSQQARSKLARLQKMWPGFKLPRLLQQMLQRQLISEEFPEISALRPFVSVRFVRSMTLPEPLSSLFVAPATHLYDFRMPDVCGGAAADLASFGGGV